MNIKDRFCELDIIQCKSNDIPLIYERATLSFFVHFNTVPTLSPIAFPFGQRPLVPLQGRGVERPSLIPKP